MIRNKILEVSAALALLSTVPVQAAPLMYVPTGVSNEIVVVDLDGHRVVHRITELENAHGLAATPDGEMLVAGSMQSAAAGAATSAKPAAVTAEDHAAHHAAGQTAAASYVSILQRGNNRVVRRIAVPGLTHHTTVSPDGKVAIAVHSDLGGVSVIDLTRLELVKTVKTGAAANYAVFSPDGGRLYVSNAGAGTVSEIDTLKWEIVRQLQVGKMPEHLILDAGGKRLYVLNVLDGTVSQIDLPEGHTARSFKVGKAPHAGALSREEKWLFVSNNADGTVSRIDMASGEGHTVPVGAAPYHVDYVGANDTLYVSSKELPKIWALDPATLAVRGEIDLGKGIGHQTVVLEK